MSLRDDILAAAENLVGLTGEDVSFRGETVSCHVGPLDTAVVMVGGGIADSGEFTVLMLAADVPAGGDPESGEEITVRARARVILSAIDHVSHWELRVGDEESEGGR